MQFNSVVFLFFSFFFFFFFFFCQSIILYSAEISNKKNQKMTFWNIFFSYFSQKTGFGHFIQILSFGDNLYEMSMPIFWKNINLPATEFALKVVKLKIIIPALLICYQFLCYLTFVMPPSNFQPIRLLNPSFWFSFTNLMTKNAYPDHLVKKPADLDLHCKQRQGVFRFSWTRFKLADQINLLLWPFDYNINNSRGSTCANSLKKWGFTLYEGPP